LSYKTNLNNDEGEIDHKVSTNYLRTRSTRMLAISGWWSERISGSILFVWQRSCGNVDKIRDLSVHQNNGKISGESKWG